jgi:hypothetical protein
VSVYLYAVTRGDAELPGCAGLRGEPLRCVRAASLAAVVSTAAERSGLGTESDMWEHERVVEMLMAGHDVLPARFATIVETDADVQRVLLQRRQPLERALERVSGSFEVGVRAVLASRALERTPDARGSGTSYLLEATRRRRISEDVGERIERTLRPLARARRARPSQAGGRLVTSAWLIDRERLSEFRDRAARLGAELEDCEVVCTGPWPPYSFVEAGETA